MKNVISSLVLFAAVSLTASALAGATPATKEVTIGLSEAYIPGGFSSATDAFVVVSGMFPNSCYRWSHGNVAHTSAFMHEVKGAADVTMNTMCLMVMIPFQKEVSLGRLHTGEHTVRFMNGDGTYFEKTLTVE